MALVSKCGTRGAAIDFTSGTRVCFLRRLMNDAGRTWGDPCPGCNTPCTRSCGSHLEQLTGISNLTTNNAAAGNSHGSSHGKGIVQRKFSSPHRPIRNVSREHTPVRDIYLSRGRRAGCGVGTVSDGLRWDDITNTMGVDLPYGYPGDPNARPGAIREHTCPSRVNTPEARTLPRRRSNWTGSRVN